VPGRAFVYVPKTLTKYMKQRLYLKSQPIELKHYSELKKVARLTLVLKMADREQQPSGEERDPISGMLNRDLDAIAEVFAAALSQGYNKDDEDDGVDEMALFELLLDEVLFSTFSRALTLCLVGMYLSF
jgi:hypothetical protein